MIMLVEAGNIFYGYVWLMIDLMGVTEIVVKISSHPGLDGVI